MLAEETAPSLAPPHEYAGLPPVEPGRLHERRERVFLVLAGLFLGTLAMLNILGISRFIVFGEIEGYPIAVAVGVLPYPLTFLATDFISELYGKRRANFLVLVGLLLNVWVIFILWLGGALPGTDSPAFFEIRRNAFGAVTASMLAYLAAQFIDVHVFHFWKTLTRGRHLWLRNNGSTLVSQLVDTTAVVAITYFAASLPLNEDRPRLPQLAVLVATAYLFKLLAALADTLPFYFGSRALARYLRLPPPGETP